jgi:hypothetical protein
MRRDSLSGDFELLQAPLIIFSAVSLATLEFMKHAFPSIDALQAPKTTVVYMIVLVQVLPALVLLSADRLIAARDKSGRGLRIFRSVVFAVALLLILRQLQLYWDPAKDFTDSVRSASLVLLVFVDLLCLATVVGLAIGLFRGLVLFFYYMSPVAIAMTAIIPFQVPTGGSLPETYGQEVVTATHSESKPAVFIFVFDGLGSYALGGEGKLNEESFPNIAALAQDGVWFTDATTNYFWSKETIASIINPAKSLAKEYDIRLYTQYPVMEKRYINDCGKVITCRGVGYLTENDQLRVAGNLALRSFYQATPKPLETAMSRPMGWLLDRLGWAYPSMDRPGWHTFTKRQFDVFLDDIKGRQTLGRIHVLHLLLPHHTFAFNAEGDALSAPSSDPQMKGWREQSMYVDVLVGRVMSKLEKEGIYDKAVIIITGDHGMRSSIPSLERGPKHFTTDVPLVIHAPGLSSRVSDVDYQHVDFGATLTDVLGLPPPEGTEGISAFSEERPERDKVFHYNEWTYTRSREDGDWHFNPEK